MALLERLQILIDADAGGAVREFKKIGNTADRELGKATKSMDRMSSKLTSFGAGAVVGAAALGAGLAMFAKEASAAETQQLKLTNSIKNSSAAFPGNGKALRDQASALQKVTVADDDAIVSAQALLVQFGRTSKETEQLTPLVVDLSRKMGIDLDSAAKAVGKSSDGSSGALKKMGIQVVDLGGGATATQNTIAALASTVGGFATSEGQTFAGQMQIMSNSFSELKENVGKGVLEIVNPILGIGAAAGSVNPEIASTAGKLGTIGAGAAGMIGTVSIATGALMKMKGQFTQVTGSGAAATTSLTGAGKAAGAIGAIGAAVAIYEIGNALNDASFNADKFAASSDRLSTDFAKTGKIDLEKFNTSAKATTKLGDRIWDGINKPIQSSNELKIDGYTMQIDDVLRKIQDLKKSGKSAELKAALLLFQGATFDPGARGQKRGNDFANTLNDIRDGENAAGEAAEVAAGKGDKLVGTMEDLAASTKTYDAQLKFMTDTQKLGADRAANFSKAIEDTTTLDNQAVAAFGMNDAYKGLFNTLNDLPKQFDPVKAALGDYTDEQNKAVESVIGFGDKAGSVLEQAVSEGGDPRFLGGIFRSRLEEVLKNANIPPDQIAQYIGLAGLSPQQLEFAVTVSFAEEEKQKYYNYLTLLNSIGEKLPPEIVPKIKQLQETGLYAEANALIAALQDGVTKPQIDFLLAAYPDLAPYLADTLAKLQAQADAAALALTVTLPPIGTMLAFLIGDAQNTANTKPINVPVLLSPFGDGGLFAPGGLLNPGNGRNSLLPPNNGAGSPGGGGNTAFPPQPGFGDSGFGGGSYSGGPAKAGMRYEVNEGGREFFTPSSDGFIMNAGDAQTLIQGVSQLVSSGGGRGGMVNNFTVITPDAETAASATARKLRDAAWRN